MVLAVALVAFIVQKLHQKALENRRMPKIPGHVRGGFFSGPGGQGRHAPVTTTELVGGYDEEDAGETTKLHIEVSATERCALKISMSEITCMEDLQELVAEVCEEAGYKDLDDLAMAYKDEEGEYRTVTRSVTIEMLKSAPALRLAPAAERKERASKKEAKSEAKSGKGASSRRKR